MYSDFWLAFAAGAITLSAIWAERDAHELAPAEEPKFHPAEDLSFGAWERLGDAAHARIISEYSQGARKLRYGRRSEAA